MTVCIAAICDNSVVVGMSDRMLTWGDIQFQPSTSKIWVLTNSIVMMSAGDVGLQTDIYLAVRRYIAERLEAEPTRWLQVREVAEQYRAAYFNIKNQRAEKAILGSMGLTRETFIANQRTMDPGLVSSLASELISFRMADIAAIIAGNSPGESGNPDAAVPHIFAIDNGDIMCADKVGFACVGVGAWHANSAMMLLGHTASTPAPKGVLNIFFAKKRAEIAPGVGSETDTFMVINRLGSHAELKDEIKDRLIEIYKMNSARNARALKKAEESLNAYLEETTKPKQPQLDEPKQPQVDESPATDGTEP